MRDRLVGVWRRVLGLSWPVMAEQTTRTLMRTVDIVVTALFSPAAVAAIGLADLYARFPLWIGLGMGGGAIALSSQDTGSGSTATRDEAISTALVIGAVLGIPFVVFGLLFGEAAIALLGASPSVARQGGTYLTIVFVTAPARHVGIIAARSLQGTGDTRTPMYVNVGGNVVNIVLSVALGLGVGALGIPRLAIVGVGIATAVTNVLIALALLAALVGPWARASLTRPTDPVVAAQLVRVSAPSVGEGVVSTLVEFPFNAILLGFGTEVTAAFHIGRRAYQQLTGPFSRGYNVGTSILVGQALGEGDPDDARFVGWATAGLGVLTVGGAGVLLALGAGPFVRLFTADPLTAAHAATFARVYGLTGGFLAVFAVLQGALRGASETRTPFLARSSGLVVFMLGFTYLVGVVGGVGAVAAYAGIALAYAWMALVVAVSFHRSDWAGRAARMMSERGSRTTAVDED